jgi:Tol biopolymer transport system component
MKPSYSPELKKFVDSKTGRCVIQWTNSPAKDQHFYFTTYSITQDDRWLVFISERDGKQYCLYLRPRGNL